MHLVKAKNAIIELSAIENKATRYQNRGAGSRIVERFDVGCFPVNPWQCNLPSAQYYLSCADAKVRTLDQWEVRLASRPEPGERILPRKFAHFQRRRKNCQRATILDIVGGSAYR